MTSRWDPHWQVTRVNGQAIYLHHQQSGKARVVNREKVRIVDPNIQWDEIRPRPLNAPFRPPRQRRPMRSSTSDDNAADNLADEDSQSDVSDTPPAANQQPITLSRPVRQRRLTYKAQQVSENQDSDDLLAHHYRKRKRSSAPTEEECRAEKYRLIAYVSSYFG